MVFRMLLVELEDVPRVEISCLRRAMKLSFQQRVRALSAIQTAPRVSVLAASFFRENGSFHRLEGKVGFRQ